MGGSDLRINQGWVEESEKKEEVKIKELIETDGRYVLRELAKIIGISLSKVHKMLQCSMSCCRFYHRRTCWADCNHQ